MNIFEQAADTVDNHDGEFNQENVIEWIKNNHTATCAFTQIKYVNKIRDLAKRFPDKVEIIAENPDGSIVAHIPVRAVKLQIVERELTDEQREILSERMKNLHNMSRYSTTQVVPYEVS